MENINERLLKVKEQQRKKRKWESQLASYKNEAEVKVRECETLHQQLLKEEKDVEKLTHPSFANLLFTVIGKKEDRLDRDKQELLAASLKYEEAHRAIQQINQVILELKSHLDTLPDIDGIYHEILEEKERMIQDAGSPLTEEYFTLTNQLADLNIQASEIQEAINAGERVLNTLNQALEALDRAESWGTFDLFGGGLITTAIKHDYIDDSTEWIHRAQADMRLFQKELADIHLQEDLNVDLSGLLTFADYFFDGFITDWIVQGRINDSIAKVERQSQEIEDLLNRLQQNLSLTENAIQQTAQARTALIENA